MEAEITQELLDLLLKNGLVVSDSEDGIILGFTSERLAELSKIALENEDGIVLVLVKPKEDENTLMN